MGAVLAFQPMPRFAKDQWLSAQMARADLSPGAKLCAWGLVSFHNEKTGQCNPAAATLAVRIGLTVRGVQKGLAALAAAGAVVVMSARGRRGSNGYILAGVNTNDVRSERPADTNEAHGDDEHCSAQYEPRSSKPFNNPKNHSAGTPAQGIAGQEKECGALGALRAALERMKGRAWVARWLSALGLLSAEGGRVCLSAPSRMVRDYLDGTAGIELRRAAALVWPGLRGLSVVVAPR